MCPLDRTWLDLRLGKGEGRGEGGRDGGVINNSFTLLLLLLK